MKRSVKRRRPGIERLEQRWLLAGDGMESGFSNWHNESHPSDVNGDGQVSPFDALIVVNALKRFDPVSVEEVQADWYESNAEATELYGGYHPDVDGNGRVTSLDALRIINRLEQIASSPQEVPISVIPDAQGNALRIVYSSRDGRSIELDVGQKDLTINWSDGSVLAADANDEVVVIARPGVGILEVEGTTEDGQAIVTRLRADGTKVIERYVCVPAMFISDDGIIFRSAPDDVRRPIDGFEEVLGAIVERRTLNTDGSEITLVYEEAAVVNLLSVSASLLGGENVTVNVEGATFGTATIVLRSLDGNSAIFRALKDFESDLLELLQRGYQPLDVVTPSDIRLALEAEGIL